MSILKGEEEARSIDTLRKVAVGLVRICAGAPAEAQWQAFEVFVESLSGIERPLPAEVVKMLRRVDAEIRRFARDGAEAFLAPVHKALIQQLLDAAEMRRASDAQSQKLRERAEFGPAIDEVSLSGREALVSATAALREDLLHIKDELDLYVRASDRQPEALQGVIAPLRKVASSCSVLGLESSRSILLDLVDELERIAREDGEGVQPLLNVAASLVQVEDNLAGMSKTANSTDLERLQSDAERQVLAESRTGLETVKQAIVDFVSSEFEPEHLEGAPMQIFAVCGALNMAELHRPVAALKDCRAFIEEELLGYAGAPSAMNWERLDRFADCISGIDYYLERLGEESEAAAEDVIQVVERSLRSLGYEGRGADLGVPRAMPMAPSAQDDDVPVSPAGTELSPAVEALSQEEAQEDAQENIQQDAQVDVQDDPQDVLQEDLQETAPEVVLADGGLSAFETSDAIDDDGIQADDVDQAAGEWTIGADENTADDASVLEAAESGASVQTDGVLDLGHEMFDAPLAELESPAETVVHSADEQQAWEADTQAELEPDLAPQNDVAPHANVEEEQPPETALFDPGMELDSNAQPQFSAEATTELAPEPGLEATPDTPPEAEPDAGQAPELGLSTEPGTDGLELSATESAPRSEFDLAAMDFDGLDSADSLVEPEQAATPAVDADILEVFIEEVDEVLETIDASLEAWRQETQNVDARADVRRAFHTLKGSGRLVGANRLGEVAWSVENMLNRVIDGTVVVTDDIFSVAARARALVPDLMSAFRHGTVAPEDDADQLVENADVLASGGSLAGDAEAEELSEELSIFVEEVRQIVEVLKSRTGRRRVQLDDDVMIALHTLVGSASLVQQPEIERLGDAMYETARAFQAEALRGPNTEVEIARLFQDALDYLEITASQLDKRQDVASSVELVERAQQMLASADDTPAEEMLVGLAQLDVVMNAGNRFDRWSQGEDAAPFIDELRGALQAIIGATFRPQVTDLARSLAHALEAQDADAALDADRAGVLKLGCERLLATVDAIAADQALPRVDDMVTALADLAAGIKPEPLARPQLFEDRWAIESPAPQIQAPSPVAAAPAAVMIEPDRDVDPELAEVFFEEAEELMEALEATLNHWSDERDNRLHLENLLRVLHTLKGSARLAGLARTGDEVHQFESFLIDAQNQEIPVDDALFARSEHQFEAVAALLALTQNALGQSDEPAVATPAPAIVPAPKPSASEAPPALVAKQPPRAAEQTPPPTEPRTGQEMVRVRSALLEGLVNLAGENSILRARIEQGMGDFAAALDEMETTINRTKEQVRRLEIETEAQIVYRQEHLDAHYESFDPLEMDRYSKLQQLTRALSESASDMLDLKDTLLFKARESETLLLQQARVNTELQEGLMRTRMVPFSRLLPRLRRIVRQISVELGKTVDFHAYNAEGELDRNLLERMIPPLEHMLRNAVDHGIEAGDVRRNFGKAPNGRIDLRLSREGGDIVIEIADDGAGIDVEAVRSKAAEKGLMHPQAELSDEEVLEYVLAPGFSTAKSVTQISGRGVGLDVVNSEVKQLGGSVSISSTPGKGTRFTVRVPFTVSVNRALMVGVGDDHYAIPLNTIEGIVLLDPEHLDTLYKSADKTFEYAGVAYRVRYLGHFIGRTYSGVQGNGSVPVVLVRAGDQAIAVHVDTVQGSREIVVKSLGPQFAGVGGISGATILGDGSVVVILDLLALIRAVGREGIVASAGHAELARPNPCVMVVDDSVTVRKVTARLLERQGMDVIVAKDGVEAVALLQERRPDVMLLDIEMPRMDGFEVARQVRHDDGLAQLPIIMISSRTGSKHTEHAKELGVDRFLGKPFQENELLGAIEELVGQVNA